MEIIKPLNTEEIKDCFDKLGEIEDFEISQLKYNPDEYIYISDHGNILIESLYKYKTLYPHFLTRVIEAINIKHQSYDFVITMQDNSFTFYFLDDIAHFDSTHFDFTDYNSIDEAKTAVIRKYLEVVNNDGN